MAEVGQPETRFDEQDPVCIAQERGSLVRPVRSSIMPCPFLVHASVRSHQLIPIYRLIIQPYM